jgi:hypothetical protein
MELLLQMTCNYDNRISAPMQGLPEGGDGEDRAFPA